MHPVVVVLEHSSAQSQPSTSQTEDLFREPAPATPPQVREAQLAAPKRRRTKSTARAGKQSLTRANHQCLPRHKKPTTSRLQWLQTLLCPPHYDKICKEKHRRSCPLLRETT
ncbi:hypothetical protein AJ80_04855 [Polytolypa hystricis UAMH7299]|uniref:Uncharacterized protein n=1 Tax=Polytolypa hystricis (strain UAMH7299) TaxID=1447883 RepID=A0A2B7Y8H9_POLH7|nr:hypothetical protein AJ80_04855 [Polytolypa hystricis UAMH7299]